jgi:hypothetical protein
MILSLFKVNLYQYIYVYVQDKLHQQAIDDKQKAHKKAMLKQAKEHSEAELRESERHKKSIQAIMSADEE